jgi:hypothetical protein
VAAQEAEHQQVDFAQAWAFRKHAGAGSVDVALLHTPCMLHGCLPVVARILLGQWQVGAKDAGGGCYLGGGRLGVGSTKAKVCPQ